MRHLVLLAPNGQVGFELARTLPPLGQVTTISRSDIDFCNLDSLATRLQSLKPDIIVNAAAYTAVDKAESDNEQAYTLNTALPAMLAKQAKQHNAWLVHYSTDYVYPGTPGPAWRETDTPGPLNLYGLTKLAGDQAIAVSGCKHLIFRTSWVYAARGKNFMRTILQLAQQRQQLQIVSDQIGAPTPARLIAQVTGMALQQVVNGNHDNLSGLYHLSCSGSSNWHQFARAIIALAKAQPGLTLVTEAITAISSAQYPTPAARPLNSALDCQKLTQTFGICLPDWQTQLELTFAEWLEHRQ